MVTEVRVRLGSGVGHSDKLYQPEPKRQHIVLQVINCKAIFLLCECTAMPDMSAGADWNYDST